MKATKTIDEDALKQELAKQGYNSVTSIIQKDNSSLTVEASKLHPAYIAGKNPLYVTIPVSLSVSLNNNKHVEHVQEEPTTPDTYQSAETFVKTLIQNNQLNGAGSHAKKNATHTIEVNDKGQHIIRRQGYNAF